MSTLFINQIVNLRNGVVVNDAANSVLEPMVIPDHCQAGTRFPQPVSWGFPEIPSCISSKAESLHTEDRAIEIRTYLGWMTADRGVLSGLLV